MQEQEQKQKINIQDYLQMFLRRKWFVIVPLIVISIAFIGSSFFLPKIYEARAVIIIEEKKLETLCLRTFLLQPPQLRD